MIFTLGKSTIRKFDVSAPRYTSYPTAPEWSSDVGAAIYQKKLEILGLSEKTLSLYLHLPFCKSMCYYCACNVIIRPQDDKYANEYIEYLDKEMQLVRRYLGRKKIIRQLHWGGGTPTFLSEVQIERLFLKIQQYFEIDFSGEVAIEVDPRTIDKSKLKLLRTLGFNRVSMGIQDFDPDVQAQVNRHQPFELVKGLYDYCRELKFQSINYDLIYGLPGQTLEHFDDTVQKVLAIRPDRIALYSFAYVPWLKKHQSKLDEKLLPSNDEKLDIFLSARDSFLKNDYESIAMDHFALKGDEMAKAFHAGRLYRNFMGYTVKPADEYLGLGVTSIGFLENTFIQNHKVLSEYYRCLDQGDLAVERGKELTLDDQLRQWVISQLMCHFTLDKMLFVDKFMVNFDEYFAEETEHLDRCVMDGLLEMASDKLKVTDKGKIFIRNVCMGFDRYLRQAKNERRFSKTV